MKINHILKLEAVAFFIATVWLYCFVGAGWWMFFILLLVPNIYMVGYVKNSKINAYERNYLHNDNSSFWFAKNSPNRYFIYRFCEMIIGGSFSMSQAVKKTLTKDEFVSFCKK